MKRQLSDTEKLQVRNQQLASDGSLKCFISGLIIAPEDAFEYDHIQPFSQDGETSVANVRIVLKEFNRRKSDQSLYDVRDALRLEQLFARKKNDIKLQDILELKDIKKNNIHASIASDEKTISFDEGSNKRNYPLLQDEILKVPYFYGRIPVAWLENDDQEGLQPRVIDYKRLIAIRDHLKNHPQLAPSIGRLVNQHLKLFDGQHKLAAQILNGQTEVDLKIYIAPDNIDDSKRLFDNLMITNLEAHSNLKQIPFYTSTLLDRLSTIYREMLDEFMSKNSVQDHTELNFVGYLANKRGFGQSKSKDMLRSAIKSSALEKSELNKFVATASKDSNFPITVDLLDKTVFRSTLYLEASTARFTSNEDFRNDEVTNFAELSKILVAETRLTDWVPNSKGKSLTNEQQKARRIWHKGAVLTWTPYLKSVLRFSLRLMTTAENEKMLYRPCLKEQDLVAIQTCLARLFSHPMWDSPDQEIDSLLVSAQRQDTLFERQGLTESFVLYGKSN